MSNSEEYVLLIVPGLLLVTIPTSCSPACHHPCNSRWRVRIFGHARNDYRNNDDQADVTHLLGVSMIPGAEIAMLIIIQASILDKTLSPPQLYSAMVLVVVLTSIISPIVLKKLNAS